MICPRKHEKPGLTMRIKVTYPGPLNTELDEKIRKAMESIGAYRYAQGTSWITGIRDLAFDIEVDHVE